VIDDVVLEIVMRVASHPFGAKIREPLKQPRPVLSLVTPLTPSTLQSA
jgi:hypothetical protein